MISFLSLNNIRSRKVKKSRRRRQCAHCGGYISKGDYYVNTEIRYDITIMTFSHHTSCQI